MSRTSSRPRALVAAGVVAGAALVLAAPLAASAHIHVTPEESAAGTSTRLDFSFSHGCDDSPTTAVVFTIPEGIDGVTPVLNGAWTISRELGDDGIPTQVTYTAVTPVESGTAATVSLDVIFASSAAETSVAFPVLQRCVEGETDWSEVAAEGQTEDDLEAPAPVVAVGAVSADTGHGHGDAEESEDAADDSAAHEGDHAETAAPSASEPDAVARWLGGSALVAALAALGVAIAGRRRKV
ncbi:MAG: nuclear export factor GLE1 [Microbacterium sp.]|nr:MAG: nuclear export factor GLE1 [Microbacterium sp.]